VVLGRIRGTGEILKATLKYTLIFLLPLFFILGILYFMTFWTIFISFTDWVGMRPNYNLVGIKWYEYMVSSDKFWISLRNNILWLIVFIFPTLFLGLMIAYILELYIVKGESIFRTIFLYPTALSFVVTGTLWAWIYDPANGVLNSILSRFGIDTSHLGWICDPNIAIYCLIAAAIWQYTGFAVVLFQSALRGGYLKSMIEAALVDGASGWRLFRYIVVPNIKSAFIIVIALLAIFSLKVFDLVYVMTQGGPGISTYVLAFYMYMTTFWKEMVSLGAAISVVIFSLSMIIIIPYSYYALKRWLLK